MALKKKLILIFFMMATVGLAEGPFFRSSKRPPGKHVFLITIDTLRADHLGCYGYPRDTSPFIDSLAGKGVLFERAISQSATTCPSHASIFTGLYPSQHRVRANGFVLDDEPVTLAEILRKSHYDTAAFTSTDRHFFRTRLHRGFTFYDEPQNTFLTYKSHFRPAEQTIGCATRWITDFDPSRNLFLWIHLYDPHQPFRRQEAIYKKLDAPEQREAFREYLKKRRINLEIFRNDIQKAYEYITTYDAEVRYADGELEKLFRLIKAKGMMKDSCWIITSDHGESLGQHDWLGHGTPLYQEDILVPLIFYWGEEKAVPAHRVRAVVENFDIFPTVLDLLRIEADNKVKKEIQAVSLLPQILGESKDNRKTFAFTERTHYITRPTYKPRIPFWWRLWEDGEKFSVQIQRWKYIRRTHFEDELYDLEADPLELHNLIVDRRNIAAYPMLYGEIARLMRLFEKYNKKKIRLADGQTIKKLRTLGYL